MDVVTSITTAVESAVNGAVPSEFAVLLWAPLLLITLALFVWLAVLIAMQQKRQRAVVKASRNALRWGWLKRSLERPATQSRAVWEARHV